LLIFLTLHSEPGFFQLLLGHRFLPASWGLPASPKAVSNPIDGNGHPRRRPLLKGDLVLLGELAAGLLAEEVDLLALPLEGCARDDLREAEVSDWVLEDVI